MVFGCYGFWLGVLPGVPSHRLRQSYFLWILAEQGTAIRPPGVDLEGVQQHSKSPILTVLMVLPKRESGREREREREQEIEILETGRARERCT